MQPSLEELKLELAVKLLLEVVPLIVLVAELVLVLVLGLVWETPDEELQLPTAGRLEQVLTLSLSRERCLP